MSTGHLRLDEWREVVDAVEGDVAGAHTTMTGFWIGRTNEMSAGEPVG